MKKSLLVILLGVLFIFAGCNRFVPISKYDSLENENKILTNQTEQLNAKITALESEKTALAEKITERRTQEITDPFDEKILGSLFLRPDLIPVGGEKMRYYTDLCRVLGEEYVYAYAEDGRNTADMILSYKLREDSTYEWILVAFDKGKGWEIPTTNQKTDTTGSIPVPNASSESTSTPTPTPTPTPTKPISNTVVPNEAQQQKFREIASLITP